MKLIKHIKFIIIRYLVLKQLKSLRKILKLNITIGSFVGICFIMKDKYPITFKYLDNNHISYRYNTNQENILPSYFDTYPYWFPNHPHKFANEVRIQYINYLITNINTLLPITLTTLNNLKNK